MSTCRGLYRAGCGRNSRSCCHSRLPRNRVCGAGIQRQPRRSGIMVPVLCLSPVRGGAGTPRPGSRLYSLDDLSPFGRYRLIWRWPALPLPRRGRRVRACVGLAVRPLTREALSRDAAERFFSIVPGRGFCRCLPGTPAPRENRDRARGRPARRKKVGGAGDGSAGTWSGFENRSTVLCCTIVTVNRPRKDSASGCAGPRRSALPWRSTACWRLASEIGSRPPPCCATPNRR